MLFENDFNDYAIDFLFDIPGSSFTNDNFVSPKEGLMRGSLSRNEFIPYKNLTYFKLNPRNELEKDLLEVTELNFAITDLNLYLDLHPNDQRAYELLKKYSEDVKKAQDEYSRKFGPLCLTDTQSNTYLWSKNPWPWDNEGGSMYV